MRRRADPEPQAAWLVRIAAAVVAVLIVADPSPAGAQRLADKANPQVTIEDPTGDAGRQFGRLTLVLEGDHLAVDSIQKVHRGDPQDSSVFLFHRTESETWEEQKKIPNATNAAIDGDTAAIAKTGDPEVQIYKWAGSQWNPTGTVTAAQTTERADFGDALALAGDYLAVGASGEPHRSEPIPDVGSTYVYLRTDDGWEQIERLQASDAGEECSVADDAENARFGHAVALNREGRLIVTANRDDFETSGGACVEDQGSAYLFRRSQEGGNAWSEVQKLTPPKRVGRQERMNFGNALAMGPTTALIGAQWYDLGQDKPEGAFAQGTVCAESRKGFRHEAFIEATDHPAARRLGKHVAMDGNLAAVTNNPWDSWLEEPWKNGRVYVYTRSPCGDSQLQPFGAFERIEAPTEVPDDPKGNNGFGGEVAVDAGRIAVSQDGDKAVSTVHLYHLADAPPSLTGKDQWSVQEDGSTTIPLDELVDASRTNCFRSVRSRTGADRGTVRELPCQRVLEYTPPADYNGSDTIEYAISDGYGGRVEGTIDVTVEPVDDPPSFVTAPPGSVTIDLAEQNERTFTVVGRDIDSEVELTASGLGDGVEVAVETRESGDETTWGVMLTATPEGVGRHSVEFALASDGKMQKETVEVTVYPTDACARVECGTGRVCHRGLCLREVQRSEADTGTTEAEPGPLWGDTGAASSGRGCRMVPAGGRKGPGGRWWLVVLSVGGLAALRLR